MVRRLQVKADEGLSGGCRHSVYKRISLLKSDAGPCDGHGGCSPCLPQSHLTESQMADFHDKPGRIHLKQRTFSFSGHGLAGPSLHSTCLVGSEGQALVDLDFLCLRWSFVSNKTKTLQGFNF